MADDTTDARSNRRAAIATLLFNRASVGLLVFDEAAELVEASESLAAIVGETTGSLLGQNANELFEPHPSEGPIGTHVRRLASGDHSLQSWETDVFVRRAHHKRTVPARLTLSSFDDPMGDSRLVLGLLQPVRQHDEVARSLIQADRLSSIGLLAGSAGHEIKNDLGPLIGYLSLLEAQGSDDPMVGLMRESVRRIHDHVEQVLEPLRPRVKTRGPIVLRKAVDDAVVGMRRAGKLKRVTFEIVEDGPETGDVVVHADRDEVEQIVLNLLANADDALGDESGGNRGSITVRLSTEGSMGVYEVEDDGPGMDDQTRARAFDPRFTTKDHRGTGLGLPAIRLIARDLGGTVSLRTSAGEGTTVCVAIPLFRG